MAKDVSSISSGDQAAEQADQIAKVVEAANQFACDLYSRVACSTPGNLFFSPSSVWTALAMTYAGAAGDTAKEMAKTLHLDLPDDQLHPAIKLLHESIRPASVKLSIANRLWGQAGYRFLPEFTEAIEQFYGASLKEVDFRGETETARLTINEWVEEQTAGRIRDFFPPGTLESLNRLVLVNAIYFLGRWAFAFDEKKAYEAPFFVGPDLNKSVPMMRTTRRLDFRYFDDLTVVDVPYQCSHQPLGDESLDCVDSFAETAHNAGTGDLVMTILLPRQPDGLSRLESQITPDALRRWTELEQGYYVDLYLPSFRFASHLGLNNILKSLGMQQAFVLGDADFSRMSDDPNGLFLGTAIHKAVINVDEAGTEAAAATGVAMVFGYQVQPDVFKADHPFVFLIRDRETGLILFCGRVADPSA